MRTRTVEERTCDLHPGDPENAPLAVDVISIRVGDHDSDRYRRVEVCQPHLDVANSLIPGPDMPVVTVRPPKQVTIRGGRTAAKKTAASKKGARNGKAANGVTTREIREWAGANGVTLPTRGPIPRAVKEQYAAATSG